MERVLTDLNNKETVSIEEKKNKSHFYAARCEVNKTQAIAEANCMTSRPHLVLRPALHAYSERNMLSRLPTSSAFRCAPQPTLRLTPSGLLHFSTRRSFASDKGQEMRNNLHKVAEGDLNWTKGGAVCLCC